MKALVASFLFAMVFCSPVAKGQTADITLDSHPSPEQIQSWLLSTDPHLVAWGGYFAGETDDQAAIPILLRLVSAWNPPEQFKDDEATRLRVAPAAAAVDALTRLGAVLPANLVAQLAPHFPIEATVLAGRMPASESTSLFLNWYNTSASGDESRVARVSAMFLAKNPPPGFAAGLVADWQVNLVITVVSPGSVQPEGGLLGSACGDGMGRKPKTDWPPSMAYLFEEDNPRGGPVVVQAGGDVITYVRLNLDRGWGSCNFIRPLNSETRQHLIAQMLSSAPNEIPWKPEVRVMIEWHNEQQYRQAAEKAVASEQANLHALGRALQKKGLLTPDEVRGTTPTLSVAISDKRNRKDSPLPKLEIHDPHTVFAPSRQETH